MDEDMVRHNKEMNDLKEKIEKAKAKSKKEDRAIKFKRVGNKRLLKAIKYIRMVKNMSLSFAYDMSEEDVKKITERLHDEVEEIQYAFNVRNKKQTIEKVL